MKMSSITKAVVCLAVTLLASPLWAGSVTIVSPDKVKTNSESRVKERFLRWNDKDKALYADITFSNDVHAGASDPLNEEYFLFKIPGVIKDSETKTFYAQDESGQRVPVATYQKGLFGRHLTLSPGTYIHIQKNHGNVRVVMTLSTTPPKDAPNDHWLEEKLQD